ncbi:cysteine desulfurase family protein [Sulfurivermis fontis]|uniref:cysteine desulfurase family protein n=1 Tax=Sulfurivermis fontis TaxID=1972068 RepID=UPI000FD9CE5B|nr:cysteine desulfurase family protein [Sulfurivermis fontis]
MIYLDHNATTPLDERVLEAMLPWLRGNWGNPSSVHALGRAARAALEQAREQVAALAGAHPSQVIFTSGGTEANNAALKGVAARLPAARLAASAVEHASVQQPLAALGRAGWTVASIPVTDQGQVTVQAVEAALREGARLVSVMWANNETGVVNDIGAIAGVVRAAEAVLHTDAVQALGKWPVDFAASGAHLMSVSAHKLNGPKGVGALLLDKAVDMEPLLHGGGQEKGRRGGTENLAGIVGFGRAAELAAAELASRRERLLKLRQRLERGLQEQVPQAVVFAARAERLPNTVFLALPGIDGETLLLELDRLGLALSSGAACGSGYSEPSHVLRAMGVAADLARCAVRVSLGAGNTEQDVDTLIAALRQQAARLQTMAAMAW